MIPGFKVIRRLPDGLVEIADRHGRRRRCEFIQCIECSQSLPDYVFNFGSSLRLEYGPQLCPECVDQARLFVKAERARLRNERIRELGGSEKSTHRRYAAMVRATPAWRDKEKIAAIYAECRKISFETGEMHHVDHYYPIQGKYSCGLHVHQNLRIVKATLNWSKGGLDPIEDWMIDTVNIFAA